MKNVRAVLAILVGGLLSSPVSADSYTPGQRVDEDYESFARMFLDAHCVDCHGDSEPEGNLSLHDLGPVDEVSASIWRTVWAQVTLKEMPPRDAEQPDVIDRLKFSDWIVGELTRTMRDKGGFQAHLDPDKGNFVDHDLLLVRCPRALSCDRRLLRPASGVSHGTNTSLG